MEEDQIEKYMSNEINDTMRILVSNFAILWNMYEGEFYEKEYSYKKAKFFVKNHIIYDKNTSITINHFYTQLMDYFKKRGFIIEAEDIDSEFSVRIIDDCPGDISLNDLRELIKGSSDKDKLLFLLLIIGRVRNNMFHGIKMIGFLNKQEELFRICNDTLWFLLVYYTHYFDHYRKNEE